LSAPSIRRARNRQCRKPGSSLGQTGPGSAP
jgi:hypothetical protein